VVDEMMQQATDLRAKGEAMLPVNAATATIAFGRAAQVLCSLRAVLGLPSSSSPSDAGDGPDRAALACLLDAEVHELSQLAKSRFLTFSKKSAFILFATDSHQASLDAFFHADGLLKWDAFVAPLVHMDKGAAIASQPQLHALCCVVSDCMCPDARSAVLLVCGTQTLRTSCER
jgi:hypothetical protein